MSFQGKTFSSKMKQFVVNLKRYFDAERNAGSMVSTKDPAERTAKALGIGKITVKRIMAEHNKNGPKIIIPPPRSKREDYRIAVNLQPVIRQYIRSENLKGRRVSLQKLHNYVRVEHAVEIATTTLWRSLQRWGFAYGIGTRRSSLRERDTVILARRKYLRTRRANRNPDGTLTRPEVYLDETYINKNHSNQFTWYLDEDGPWVNKPAGKGPRWIIVHAITQAGWVQGAELVFQAKKRTGDYHGQMNWNNFSKWFTDQLLPNIPPHSIIIMDNAKYHNVLAEGAFPTSHSLKDKLRHWLTENHYEWGEDMLKPELFALCKKLAPPPQFQLDQIAESQGHSILRTPPYHPELQPIETCWGIVKNYMANNCDFTLDGFREHLPIALTKVTGQTCKKLIAKIVKQEEKFWIEDDQLDELTEVEDADNWGENIAFIDESSFEDEVA